MPGRGAAGVLLFVKRGVVPIFRQMLSALNSRGRVSSEVLSLHLVHPSTEAVAQLADVLSKDPRLRDVENIDKLRSNNGLRDLLSGRRLPDWMVRQYMLVVGIETVTEAFRFKYPNPNLTLQAGSIEKGETVLNAAVRETFEEARILVHWTSLLPRPIRLLGGGLMMYTCLIDQKTHVRCTRNSIYIGTWSPRPTHGPWTQTDVHRVPVHHPVRTAAKGKAKKRPRGMPPPPRIEYTGGA